MRQNKKLDALFSRIENEVREEIKKIESSFEKKKKELEKEFQKKKEAHIESEKNKHRREGELEKIKMVSAARLQARRDILKRKREIIEGVFNRGLEKIQELDKEKFRKLIGKMLDKMVSTGDENIIPDAEFDVLSEDFIKKINSRKGWSLKLKDSAAGLQGWFMVEGENYSALASSQALKEHLKELYEGRVVEELFSGGQ